MTFIALYAAITFAAFALLIYLTIAKRAAHGQRPDQVVIRRPGQRMFGPPEALGLSGREDFPFALLSQAAYEHRDDPHKVKADQCLDADLVLNQLGWTMWEDFADAVQPEEAKSGPSRREEKQELSLKEKMERVHLRAEVWWHVEERKIAVAFGGTEFANLKDWRANLRWFLPHHADEYTVIVNTFGRAFEQEFEKRVKKAGWEPLEHVHLFSTGHSLGGGLAQEFAYSLPINSAIPRIDKVYAFDPSPVTGFYSVDKKTRTANIQNLDIDRIFERGEILALLRSIVSLFVPPRRSNPTITQIRYDLFPTWNPILGHSITEFAYWLDRELKKSQAVVVSAAAGR